MKKFTGHVITLLASVLVLASCNRKEGCTDKSAENYDPSAKVENGTCILQRVKFLGLYQVNESWTRNGIPQPQKVYTTIVRAANDNLTDVFIEELHGKFRARLRVNGNRFDFVPSVYFPKFQSIEAGGGTINGNQISLRYVVTDFSTGALTSSNCNATFIK